MRSVCFGKTIQAVLERHRRIAPKCPLTGNQAARHYPESTQRDSKFGLILKDRMKSSLPNEDFPAGNPAHIQNPTIITL